MFTPSSIGLNNGTTHAGVLRPMKSRLLPNESDDSTLQAPGFVDRCVVHHERAARRARLAGEHGRYSNRRGE